jgi:hypothetical protein
VEAGIRCYKVRDAHPVSPWPFYLGNLLSHGVTQANPANMKALGAYGLASLLGVVPLTSALYENGSVIAPCDSPIYCYGDILREIELARPFEDSKTFVDL